MSDSSPILKLLDPCYYIGWRANCQYGMLLDDSRHVIKAWEDKKEYTLESSSVELHKANFCLPYSVVGGAGR